MDFRSTGIKTLKFSKYIRIQFYWPRFILSNNSRENAKYLEIFFKAPTNFRYNKRQEPENIYDYSVVPAELKSSHIYKEQNLGFEIFGFGAGISKDNYNDIYPTGQHYLDVKPTK